MAEHRLLQTVARPWPGPQVRTLCARMKAGACLAALLWACGTAAAQSPGAGAAAAGSASAPAAAGAAPAAAGASAPGDGKPADKPPECPKADPAKPLTATAAWLGAVDGQQFSAAQESARVPLPLQLQLPAGVDAAGVQVRLLQVRRDKLLRPDLQTHFAVAPALELPAPGAAQVALTVQGIPQLPPGAYQLLLHLHHRCVPLPTLTAALERPAAALQPAGKQRLEISVPFGFGAKGSAAHDKLVLSPLDSSTASALRDPRLRDVDWRTSGGRLLNASVDAAASAAEAGQPLLIRFSEPEGFPVGLSSGKLELSSPDLKTPMVIELDVDTRLWAVWIVVMVAAGIGLGWGLRQWWPRWSALLVAQQAGAQAIEKIQAQVQDIPDTAFKARVGPPLAALQQQWSAAKPLARRLLGLPPEQAAALAAAQTAAQQALEQALADLATRQQQAQQLLQRLHRLAQVPGPLPPPLADALQHLPEACQDAQDQLQDREVGNALQTLQAAQTKALQHLQQHGARWLQAQAGQDADLNQLRRLMDPRCDGPRGLAPAGGAAFAQEARQRAGELLKLPAPEAADTLPATVQAWRDLGQARLEALLQWRAYLNEDADRLLWLAESRSPPGLDWSEQAAGFERTVEAVAARLQALARTEQPFAPADVDADAACHAAQALVAALVQAVTQTAPPTATPDGDPQARRAAELAAEKAAEKATQLRSQVHTLLDQHQYFQAVLALPFVRMPAEDDGTPRVLGIGPNAAQRAALEVLGGAKPTTPEVAPAAAAAPATLADPPALPVLDPAELQLVREQAGRQLQRAQRWQTGTVAFITLAVSYAFFEERFIGTAGELIGLFFWGLSVDLSAAGLTTLQTALATGPRKPGA